MILLRKRINESADRNLVEAVQVDGADFIGNANGYDLFQVRTWQAATEFVRAGTEYSAAECWIHNEATFTQHIDNERVKFFLLAREDTNEVVMGILTGIGQDSFLVKPFDTRIKLNNFSIESGTENPAREIPANFVGVAPLFLLPDFSYSGENGMSIEDGVLTGTYAGLVEAVPQAITIPDNVTTIKTNAFTNFPAATVTIGTQVVNMEPNAFRDFGGHIEVEFESLEEAGWPADWTNSTDVLWGSNLTPEERAARAAAAEEARRRAEQERQEAEARRIEAERIAAEQAYQAMLNSIRYRVQGNEVIILGAKRGVNELEIPETIEGKPVTKIAPFAFFDNRTLTKVDLPNTIKEIGKAAFAGCSSLSLTYPKNAILFTDALDGVYRKRAIQ